MTQVVPPPLLLPEDDPPEDEPPDDEPPDEDPFDDDPPVDDVLDDVVSGPPVQAATIAIVVHADNPTTQRMLGL